MNKSPAIVSNILEGIIPYEIYVLFKEFVIFSLLSFLILLFSQF